MNACRLSYLTLAVLLTSCASQERHSDGPFMSCKHGGHMRQICIAVPLASEEEDRQAKSFPTPPEGKARVYLVRRYTTDPRQKSFIAVDGNPVGQLAPATYTMFDVTPGLYTISAQTHDASELRLTLKPGEVRYVTYTLTQFLGKVSGSLAMVDAQKGQDLVRQSKMIISTATP